MAFDYSQYGGVLIARQDKILTITLNAPETLNAFTGPMHTSMSRTWDDVRNDHLACYCGRGNVHGAAADTARAYDHQVVVGAQMLASLLEC